MAPLLIARRPTASRSRARVAAVTLAALLVGVDAAADPSPDDTDARYAAVVSALGEGESAARLWWVGWTAGFAALTVGEGAVAIATRDPGVRADAVVSLSGSALGVGSMLLFSSRAAFAYRGRLDGMDASTPEARRARLAEAERILDEAADDEILARSPWIHLAGDAVVLAGSFVLWAGYHRYASGWLNLIGGTAIAEAQILTHPTAAIASRRAYRSGTRRPGAPAVTWTFSPGPGSVTWTAIF